MTKEQEEFVDKLISDLKKLIEEGYEDEDFFIYLADTHIYLIATEDYNFIEKQVVEKKGFKNIFKWGSSIFEELFERSKTCFQDILALQDLYQKKQKDQFFSSINCVLQILDLIKDNPEIAEEIQISDKDFELLLIGCCSLNLKTIDDMNHILKSVLDDYQLIKVYDEHSETGGYLPTFALEYWIYNYLLMYIRIFLDTNIFNTRKQKLFPNPETDKSTDISRQDIIYRANNYKINGMSVRLMFESIRDWLLNDLGYTENEVKEKYNIGLEDSSSFNRLVNKLIPDYK